MKNKIPKKIWSIRTTPEHEVASFGNDRERARKHKRALESAGMKGLCLYVQEVTISEPVKTS